MGEALLSLAVGVLPVLVFLAALLALESYKLVRLCTVLAVLAAGALAAAGCYAVNGWLIERLGAEPLIYSRYGGPLSRNWPRAWWCAADPRQPHRFLVDAAILGFAVGAASRGREVYYQQIVTGPGWHVDRARFGTALMHGGATAIFAVLALTLRDAREAMPLPAVPGLALAFAVTRRSTTCSCRRNCRHCHAGRAAAAVLRGVPPQRGGGRRLARQRLRPRRRDDRAARVRPPFRGPVGRYLSSLRSRFEGPLVADLLCYLRIHTELAMRAKGLLMMRESGFEPRLDQETREKLAELRYLEKSIGSTGMLALRPLVLPHQRDLWQISMLEA